MQTNVKETLPPRSESCPTPSPPAEDAGTGKAHTGHHPDAEDAFATPSTRKVKSRSAVHSAPCHFSPRISQGLTKTLVDNSDQRALEDSLVFETSVLDDWSEASLGWRVVVPYPKYVPRTRNQTRYRSPKKGIVSRTHTDIPHCFIDCSDSDKFCPWKASVEPVTYQYVPNNGCYRNNKPGPSRLTRPVQDWLALQTASKSPKSVMDRQLQKAKTLVSSTVPELDHTGACDEGNVLTSATAETGQPQHVPPPEKRVTQSPSQKDRASEMLLFASKRLQSQRQKTTKSATSADQFMADFNTRLSVLESLGELQRHSRPSCASGNSQSTDSSMSQAGHFPGQLASKMQVKDMYAPNTTRLAIQNKRAALRSNYGEDLFTVIPMCKAETPRLRPLEKVTPKQQQPSASPRGHEGPPSHSRDPGDDDLKDLQGPAALPVPQVPDSCSINLARSAIARTNFRIEQMRNSPLRSAIGSSKPKNFFVHKGGSGLALLKNGAVRYSTVTKNM